MPTFELRTPIPAPPEAVFAWHTHPGALKRLMPPWRSDEVVDRSGSLADGTTILKTQVMGPVKVRWVAKHEPDGFIEGEQFRDRQLSGPFRTWLHTHRVESHPEGSVLVDQVEYSLPLPVPGVSGWIQRDLEKAFAWRQKRTRVDVLRHHGRPTLKVAVTGSTGLVGTALCHFLEAGGHEVVRVVRKNPQPGEVRWDVRNQTIDAEGLEGVDAVVHLAGAPIATRWTKEAKASIRSSRVDGTALLAGALAKLDRKPNVLISGSAVGFYGDRGDEVLTETSEPGTGFLADVCKAWEAAAGPAVDAGIRTCFLRTGIVLSGHGGALVKMLPPFRLGMGGPLGAGTQWMPWIDLDDLVGTIHHALYDEELSGPVNGVAPHPVQNREFAKALGRALRRPAFLPTPAFAVRLALGEMSTAVLEGQRVLPRATHYHHEYPELADSLAAQLG